MTLLFLYSVSIYRKKAILAPHQSFPIVKKKISAVQYSILQQWTTNTVEGSQKFISPSLLLGGRLSPMLKITDMISSTWVWELSKAEDLTASPSTRWSTALPSQLGKNKKPQCISKPDTKPQSQFVTFALLRTQFTMRNRLLPHCLQLSLTSCH